MQHKYLWDLFGFARTDNLNFLVLCMFGIPLVFWGWIIFQLANNKFNLIFSISLNRFDVRGANSIDDAVYWSDPSIFGTRAKFLTSDPAFLEIKV